MADDHNQRPYRSNVPGGRGPSGAPAGPAAGNDPLAELARLIGQNDPFSEFGRAGAPRQPVANGEPADAHNWPPQREPAPPAAPAGLAAVLGHAAPPPMADAPAFGVPGFGRQPFGNDLYQVENDAPPFGVPGYSPANGGDAYAHDSFPPDNTQAHPGDDDFYDDVEPSGRRIGIIAIAGVFALAVIGTAGAFGYRAVFGSSSSSSPPPVIRADTAPSKIVPATSAKDAQANKMISDRVNARGQSERLVSREEQPVWIDPRQPASNLVQQSGGNASNALPQLGSGIIGAEPKRIRTIAIHPDQPDGAPAPERAAAPLPQQQQQPPPQQRVNAVAPSVSRRPPPEPEAPAPAQAIARAPPQPSGNAPLSLSPNSSPPLPPAAVSRAAPAARPAQVASVGSGGYAVQVSSQRSEGEAENAFRTLQSRYPSQLAGRQPLIKRVDLGEKGIYFRAMVGPFGSSGEAGDLCSSLKSAGGSCLVQRN